MEDKKTKRSDKRRKTSTENGKRFTKFRRKLCKKDSNDKWKKSLSF